MKFPALCFLLLLTLCAGCQPGLEKEAKSAVSEYASDRLDEPRDYRAGRFVLRPYTRRDSVAYAATLISTADSSSITRPVKQPDSVRIGTFVHHAFQEQTKTGRVTRDSGDFVVYPNREVVELVMRPRK
ncbi:hypothetical protein SAMN02745146_0119 [Hymenobacter daecheongensis DSM 21074]|uniref:Uncharacterized protein n=1 Tax=Hymenobacter daecheongensis DSM 21074 TaxID=1121955 RepID=A0A1M6LZQ7_9BACT|nr:hypothetical protein [Hymenobacter daecheongensis]SHJ76749.1 hypothetical protein SAMN02745146_0119 [Hymenobacter daecheongensis DSM 21074]